MRPEPTNVILVAGEGLQLNLVDFGGSNNPPLLFLHGSFGHARVWDVVVNELESDQRAFALDLPGHGVSDHAEAPERFRFDVLTHDIHVQVADPRRTFRARNDLRRRSSKSARRQIARPAVG